jgi:serine/threonine protein kinase/Tol biopolymer transport system component
MTPERWARIKEIFGAALEKPEGERAAFLDDACGTDTSLRREVQRLLAEQGGKDLESPVVGILRQAAAPSLAVGSMLSHYRIDSKLGEGGMGEVYKARDTHLDRFVAIKVLPRERVADPERKRRFVQEAKAASALNHPNIITIYDIDQAEGIDFIAMEYVPGKTLDEVIPRKGMRLEKALKVAVQITEALAAAHAAGIVHRDLKPGNLMVTEDGRVKVLDFGLAKLTETVPLGEDEPTHTLKPATEEGAILGTVAYMSPEQAQGKPVDARSDIFSFGAVLYEMVTGRRAFQGDSAASTLATVIKEDPKPPCEVSPRVPRDVEQVILRCLRKDLTRRFQTAADLKVVLAELKEDSDSGKLPSAAPVPRKGRRWLWAAGFATLAALVALAGWWRLANREARPASEIVATPLTAYPGIEAWPTFSPDGNQVAFVWSGEKQDNWDIYVKLIGPGTSLRLTTDPARDLFPSWSPDGRWIAFVRYPEGPKSRLILVSALGGPERVLPEEGIGGGQLSWSPDNKWIFAGQQSQIVMISAETGERRVVTSPPPGASDLQPAVSPDGRRLSFMRLGTIRWALSVQRLTTDYRPEGEPFEVPLPNLYAYYPAWTPDGRDILFIGCASQGNFIDYVGQPTGLWRVPAAVGAPRRLAVAGDNIWTYAVSRSGRLAFARWQADCDIHRADLDADGMIRRPSVAWLPSSLRDENAQYSPDGKMVVFSSARGGSEEIWLANADGSNPRQLTSFGGHFTGNPRWCPDGKTIVFHSRRGAKELPDIFSISPAGTGLRRLTDRPSFHMSPNFSRDGKWMYFNSGRAGQRDIWKVPASGGPATRVTQHGGWLAQESADGKWLYYTKSVRVGVLWRMPLEGGNEEPVVEAVANALAFTVAERGVYYLTAKPDFSGGTIYFLGYAGGQPKTIGALDRSPFVGLSLSPDGKHLMYSQMDRFDADLMLVENFR